MAQQKLWRRYLQIAGYSPLLIVSVDFYVAGVWRHQSECGSKSRLMLMQKSRAEN